MTQQPRGDREPRRAGGGWVLPLLALLLVAALAIASIAGLVRDDGISSGASTPTITNEGINHGSDAR
jgi:hypothetical protein